MTDNQVKFLLVFIPIVLALMFAFDNSGFLWVKRLKAEKAEPVIEIDIREKLTKIFIAEIGVREATGKNDGERVEYYLASCGLGKGHPWCAALVNSCHKDAGIQGANSCWSPDWFPKNKTIYTLGEKHNHTPMCADVLGIYYPEKNRIAHVGFIQEWGEGDYTITVEGNTNGDGSREGDGVYRKRRLKNQIYKVSRWI